MPDTWFGNSKKKKPSTLQEQMAAADLAAAEGEGISASESLTQSLIAMREHNATAAPVPKFQAQPREG